MTLTAHPSRRSGGWDLHDGRRVVARVRGDASRVTAEGRTWSIARSRRWRPVWLASEGGVPVLEARQVLGWPFRIEIPVGEERLILHPRRWSLRAFRVRSSAGRTYGSIRRASWWSRSVLLDLPDSLPVLVQGFLLALVLACWNRLLPPEGSLRNP